MPKIIEVPGHGQVEFPDGMSDADIAKAIQRNMQPEPSMLQKVARQAGNVVSASIPWAGSIAAPLLQPQQTGNLVAGALRGAGSIGATLLWPLDKATDLIKGDRNQSLTGLVTGAAPMTRNEERRKAMDDALASLGAQTDSFGYGAGKIGAEIAGTLGAGGAVAQGVGRAAPALASKMPGLLDAVGSAGMRAGGATGVGGMATRMAGGGVSGAASAGLIDPEAAGTGGLLGAALPPAIAGAGRALSAVGSALRPTVAQPGLADKAINQYGIPLGLSDVAKSPMLKGLRSLLDDTFLVGKIGDKSKDAIQAAFNREVGSTFGAASEKLTPDVLDASKRRLGAEFDRLWGQNTLNIDNAFANDLQRIRADAASKLNPEQSAQIERQVQSLLSKMDGMKIPGSFANNWQSELRMIADGEKGLHKKLLADLRAATISAFNRSLSADDAAALTLTQKQYKAYKTVEPLLQKAEVGTAGRVAGDVPAGLLPEAVRQSYKSGVAQSPFADLSQIGSQFIADRVARTGGSARAMVQNSAVGGLLGAGALTNPLLAAGAIPVMAGAEKLLSSPGAARALMPGSKSQTQQLLEWLDLQQKLSRAAPALVADQ